ncbi:MAG: hypothetical protein PHD25_07085 [Bacteroidales bacterium]|nr:hypothetical protein [Bacteroidales bacterium]
MIIHFHKKPFNSQLFIFIFFILLLWVDAMIFPIGPVSLSYQTPLYTGLTILLQKIPVRLNVVFAFLLVAIQAVIINSSLINHKIITRNTLLPFLIYFVLMSYSPDVQTVHPVLIANLFLILALNLNLSIYLKPEPYKEIFNSTFFISLASLFYLPALVFLILVWISLLVYRISSLREWIITISGLLAPYLFIAFYYYWTDSFGVFLQDYIGSMFGFHPFHIAFTKPLLGETYILLGVIMAMLLIIGFVKISLETTEKVITVRKRMNVIIFWVFITLVSFLWASDHLLIHACMLAIPACILISYFFSGIRRIAVAEIFFTMIILLIAVIKLLNRLEA